MAYLIGNAEAPPGWKIVEGAPALDTQEQRQALIGKTILYGHDSKAATGWFLGTVQSSTVPPRDLKKTPTANFVVEYHKKLTLNKLAGKVSWLVRAQRTHLRHRRVVGAGGEGGGRR